MSPTRPLAGTSAVVTGASGDIGAAVVRRLVGLGAWVVAADLSSAGAPVLAADQGAVVELDLCDDASITRLVEYAGALGNVAVLVHCAGVAQVEPFVDSDPATWETLYRVNQRGPMLLTQGLLPAVVASERGRVVFVSSDGARAGAGGEAAYAATKSALFGLAKCLAREVARHGTTVNVVCPGPTRGRMVDQIAAGDDRHLARLTRAIPMKRLGEPDEVAAAIAWLAGPDASYTTGQTLSISGGITMQ